MDDTTIIVSSMLHFDFMIENEQEVTVLGCVLLGWLLWSTKGTKDSFTISYFNKKRPLPVPWLGSSLIDDLICDRIMLQISS
ncbi:hypothetical protein EL23_16675 [Paenibacillus polymyxa]|nr:hypothetical protein EL23_16675 [Paenibacillus polymyxa]